MKILHITPHYHPAIGGAEVYTKEVSERLTGRGHDVTVLTLKGAAGPGNDGDQIGDATSVNDVRVRRLRPAGRLHDLFSGLLRIPGAQQLLGLGMSMDTIEMLSTNPYGLRAFQLSLRSRPDVVAVINWYGGALAYQTLLAHRIRDFTLVGVPLFHTECDWSHSALYRQMLTHCDAVVAMTEHEKAFIDQRSSVNNAHVVGVGVNPAAFASADGHQVRRRYGIDDAPLVGYVGRMVASKGVVTLIEAMKTVWRTDPAVRLLLAGSGVATGPDGLDEIGRTLSGLSPAERSRIISVGHFADGEKASLLDALDVFAMPSIAESFGIAYLEAWVCKRAVIGARIGSTQCVIEDGVDGVLVTPGNPDHLGGSILRLLSDRATREQMGMAGHAKTMAHFTWDRITDKIEDIYHEAGRHPRGDHPEVPRPRKTACQTDPV